METIKEINELLNKGNFNDKLNTKELEKLIDLCDDINFIDEEDDGENLLEKVIFEYGYDNDINYIVKLLLGKGININYQDWYGNTALDMAIYSRSDKLIELLLEHGANPNLIKIEDSETVLDFAQMEYCMSEDKNDDIKLINIMKTIIQFNGKPKGMIFTNKIDTYLLVNTYHTYPSGLFTLNGNISIENISNVDKEVQNNFMYWLVNGRPSDKVFKEKPEHPFVLEFHEKEKYFIKYFNEIFNGEIIVGSDSALLAQKVAENKKEIYKRIRNGI
jgi:hypothetical protein